MKPTGRKSSYEPSWMLPAVAMWARDGLIEKEIASKLHISLTTLKTWKNAYPSFLAALKENKDVADAKVEQALYKKALSGDTTAMIFWLKNRQVQKWRDKRDVTLEGAEDITINVKLI